MGFRPSWRFPRTASLTLLASAVTMLVATTAPLAPLVYWLLSGLALTAALAVLVVGERSWERSVDRARAAGIVAR
ncbi:hypothetical protein CRI77_09710 [Mycolicibacterium duvalii]|nr:hypothetical protein CRI77_09710 [Mycolicibacterium duvalii]